MTPAEELSPASGEIGSYELIEEIGRGGMGVIYKARKRGSSELVAVKMLLTTRYASAEAFARFTLETQVVAALEHPYVMHIRDICLEGEVPFFSMDLAGGGSLADLLPKYRGRWRQAAELMIKVAEAVQHVHDHGVLHRDLKPGNILFTAEHEPLVSDFGLAKWLESSTPTDLTRSLTIFGTPNYVAPEQARGNNKELTVATDIYSLGAILFELLTGRPPFIGDNPLEVLRQTLTVRPPSLRSITPAVPRDLEAICTRCLKKAPHDRYLSTQAFSDDVKRWLTGEKVHAKKRTAPRLKKRRGKVPELAFVIAIVILGGLIFQRCQQPPSSAYLIAPQRIRESNLPPIFASFLDEGSFQTSTMELFKAAVLQTFGEGTLRSVNPPPRILNDPVGTGLPSDPIASGRKSGADTIICESCRLVHSQFRVVTRLVRCATGKTLYGTVDMLSQNCSAVDFVDLQKKIRLALKNKSILEVSTKEYTSSRLEAQHLFRRAEEFYVRRTRLDNENAIALYENALKLDPEYAEAWAGCAKAYDLEFRYWGGDRQNMVLAQSAAHRALQLDLYSAEAHGALGRCYFSQDRYAEACEEFLESLEIDQQSAACNAYVGMCRREMGKPAEAITWMLRAVQLDTDRAVFSGIVAETYMLLGDDLLAEHAFQRYLDSNPDMADTRGSLVVLRLWQERYAEARKMNADIMMEYPESHYSKELSAEVAFFSRDYTDAVIRYSELSSLRSYQNNWEFFGAVNPNSAIACVLMSKGEFNQAEQMLDKAQHIDEQLLTEHPNNPRLLHDLSAVEALRGNHDKALKLLEIAISAGWVEHRSTMVDPRFEALREDATFKRIITQTRPAWPISQ